MSACPELDTFQKVKYFFGFLGAESKELFIKSSHPFCHNKEPLALNNVSPGQKSDRSNT